MKWPLGIPRPPPSLTLDRDETSTWRSYVPEGTQPPKRPKRAQRDADAAALSPGIDKVEAIETPESQRLQEIAKAVEAEPVHCWIFGMVGERGACSHRQ